MFSIPNTWPLLKNPCSPLRSLHALRESHVVALERAIMEMPRLWSLERHKSYDGDLLVMLVPIDETRERFVVSRSAYGFDLGTNLGDEFQSVGCFASLGDLIAVMVARMPSVAKIAEVIA